MTTPAPTYKLNANGIPTFESLPLKKGDPHHSAWGLYGEHDELGTLNRLTDTRVVKAARGEIRTGKRWVVCFFLVERKGCGLECETSAFEETFLCEQYRISE